MNERRPNTRRFLLSLIGFCVLWVAMLFLRHKSGAQYVPVSVRADVQVSAVWLISPYGTTRELTPHAAVPGLWFPEDYTAGPAEYLAIMGLETENRDSTEVLIGESLVGSTTMRPIWLSQRPQQIPQDVPENASILQVSNRGSLLGSIPNRCFNWAGDVWMFICSASVALLCWNSILFLIQPRSNGSTTQSNSDSSKVISFAADVLRFIVFVCFLQHAWSSCRPLFGSSAPIASSVFCLFFTGLLWAVRTQTWTWKWPTSSTLWNGLAGAVILSLTAVRYLVAGRKPWLQSGDYATYLNIGKRMAAGDWESVNRSFYLDAVLNSRALLCGFPAALLGEYANLGVFIFNTAVLSYVCIYLFRMFCQRGFPAIGIAGMFFAALYPDVLWGSYLCRHDGPTILYLTLYFILIIRLAKEVGTLYTLKGFMLFVFQTVVAGILCGLTELQRGFFPFIAVSSMTYLFVSSLLVSRSPQLRRWFLQTIWMAGILFIGLQARNAGFAFLEQKSGELESVSPLTAINSTESGQPKSWRVLTPWLDSYRDSIPEEHQISFFVRKLLLEQGRHFGTWFSSLPGENMALSGVNSALEMSGAVEPSEQFPLNYFVPWFSAKAAFGAAIYFVLCVFVISRCLNGSSIPLWDIELIWGAFGFLLIVVVVGLVETAQQYDLILFVPLSINACRVLAASIHREPAALSRFRGQTFGILLRGGGLCFVLVIGMIAISGLVQQQEALTFATPSSFAAGDQCSVRCSRYSCALFPEEVWNPGQTSLQAEFVFPDKSLSTDTVRFLLSLDQRVRMLYWNFPAWLNDPLDYEVTVDSVIVASGRLSELRNAKWIEARRGKLGAQCSVSVRLFSSANTDLPAYGEEGPSIAIEYVH